MKKIITILILVFFIISNAFTQNNKVGAKYIYEFRDGTVIIGTFVKDEGGNIYINDLKGEKVYLPKVMVAQTHEVTDDNLRGGEYWFPNLHDTRYFFAPSAFGLQEGEGYYTHSFWMLWQAQYGLTDDFSIGGGTTPFGVPSTLNAKYSFNIKNDINMAMGWFWIGDLFNWSGGDIGTMVNMPYAVLTKGSKENNLTLGMGYSLGGEFSEDDSPVINIGGTYRTGRRFALIFEAWVFDPFDGDVNVLGGPGLRYFRKVNRVTAKNGAGASTWDFQLLTSPEMEGIIPMFGASKKF